MTIKNFIYKTKRLHFIGAGGISISALALISEKLGAFVSGSDDKELPDALRNKDGFYVGRDPQKALLADAVIYTSAIPADHAELVAARQANVTTLKRSEFLALIARAYKKSVAVAGCHGKTTVTCHIVQLLKSCDVPTSAHIGGISKFLGQNYLLDESEVFVTEACEYERAFLSLSPAVGIITNVDFDHPDTYDSPESVKEAFSEFAAKCTDVLICPLCEKEIINRSKARKTIAVKTDPYERPEDVMTFYEGIKTANVEVISYDFETGRSGKGTKVTLYKNGKEYLEFKLPPSAKCDVENAVFAVTAAIALGCAKNKIKTVAPQLSGAYRRMEKLCDSPTVFRDYAHHPTEISAAIEKIIALCPGKQIVCAFEPHTYSRTKALLEKFAKCFKMATRVLILPTFAAREKPADGIDSLALFNRIEHENKMYVDSYEELFKIINDINDDNVVLLLGAGDIGKIVFAEQKQ